MDIALLHKKVTGAERTENGVVIELSPREHDSLVRVMNTIAHERQTPVASAAPTAPPESAPVAVSVVINEQQLRRLTEELQKLSTWRRSLAVRRGKLERLEQSVKQMAADLAEEERDWEAEAESLRFGDPGIEIITTTGERP